MAKEDIITPVVVETKTVEDIEMERVRDEIIATKGKIASTDVNSAKTIEDLKAIMLGLVKVILR